MRAFCASVSVGFRALASSPPTSPPLIGTTEKAVALPTLSSTMTRALGFSLYAQAARPSFRQLSLHRLRTALSRTVNVSAAAQQRFPLQTAFPEMGSISPFCDTSHPRRQAPAATLFVARELTQEVRYGHKHEERKSEQRSPYPGNVGQDERLLARCQLPVRRTDLPERQPATRAPAYAGRRKAAPARPLGHYPWTQLPLCALEPPHPRTRPQHALHHRPRPRRSGPCSQYLS